MGCPLFLFFPTTMHLKVTVKPTGWVPYDLHQRSLFLLFSFSRNYVSQIPLHECFMAWLPPPVTHLLVKVCLYKLYVSTWSLWSLITAFLSSGFRFWPIACSWIPLFICFLDSWIIVNKRLHLDLLSSLRAVNHYSDKLIITTSEVGSNMIAREGSIITIPNSFSKFKHATTNRSAKKKKKWFLSATYCNGCRV